MASGKAGGLVCTLGRRLRPRPLARGRYRARRPTPGGCPRYRWPVVARRYAPLGTAAMRNRPRPIAVYGTHHRERTACAVRASPSNRRNDYPGGDSGPVEGAPSARRFAMAQAPPLTGPGRESPGPHGACRVEGGADEALRRFRKGGAERDAPSRQAARFAGACHAQHRSSMQKLYTEAQ